MWMRILFKMTNVNCDVTTVIAFNGSVVISADLRHKKLHYFAQIYPLVVRTGVTYIYITYLSGCERVFIAKSFSLKFTLTHRRSVVYQKSYEPLFSPNWHPP